jgi:hypothetical protein
MARDVKKLLQHLEADAIQPLDNGAVHQWSQNEIDALHLALAAERPLLVRGRAGHRQDAARARRGRALGWRLHAETIQPALRAARAAGAFRRRAPAGRRAGRPRAAGEAADLTRYWRPGVLWKAFGWESAQPFLAADERSIDPAAPAGHVVLIDEIDKADSDLPNSLLEVLGAAQLPRRPGATADRRPNAAAADRHHHQRGARAAGSFPAPLHRPDAAAGRSPTSTSSSSAGGRTSARSSLAEPAIVSTMEILQTAAEQLAEDRKNAKDAGVPPPGLAEYIDLLTALRRLAPGNPAKQQGKWLGNASRATPS